MEGTDCFDAFGNVHRSPVRKKVIDDKNTRIASFRKYGYARFLRKSEISVSYPQVDLVGMDPIQRGGVVIDNDGRRMYIDPYDSQFLVVGPTGTNKTTGIIIPSIVSMGLAHENLFINDLKGELSRGYANFFTSLGYGVYVINGLNPSSGNRFNILSIPSRYAMEGWIGGSRSEFKSIGQSIVSDNSKDPYWPRTAADLFAFGGGYLTEYKEPGKEITVEDIGRLISEITETKEGKDEFLDLIREQDVDVNLRRQVMPALDNAESTARCVRSGFDEAISQFTYDPDLIDMMQRSDFDPESLFGEKPVAVFFIVPPENSGANALYSIFLQQMFGFVARTCNIRGLACLPRRLNFVIDEAGVTKIEGLSKKLAFARGYNIRFTLAVQSISQLKSYGDEYRSIIENCKSMCYLGGFNRELMDDIIDTVGKDRDGEPLLKYDDFVGLRRGREALYILDTEHGPMPYRGSVTPDFRWELKKTWGEDYIPKKRDDYGQNRPAGGPSLKPKPEEEDLEEIFEFLDEEYDTYYVGSGTTHLESERICGAMMCFSDSKVQRRLLESFTMVDVLFTVDYLSHLEDLVPFKQFYDALMEACRKKRDDPLVNLEGFDGTQEGLTAAARLRRRMGYIAQGAN